MGNHSYRYEIALDVSRKATKIYNDVRSKYLDGKITDKEYFAALKIYKQAEKEWEAAFRAEGGDK